MHTGRCWNVTIEDTVEQKELMHYGAFGDTAQEVAESAVGYLPAGITLDENPVAYQSAAPEQAKVVREPEVEGSVYGAFSL